MKIKKIKDNQVKIIVYTVLLCFSLFANNLNNFSYLGGEKKDDFDLDQINLKTSDGVNIFLQNFNEEIPANNEGDGVYRLPTGWDGTPPGTFPEGTYTYPLTSTAGGHAGPLGTVHLGIIDSQSGSYTETWRTFPSPVEVGIFEFTYYMYSGGVFQSNLILESATGTDLLTITTAKPSAVSTTYTISLEGIDSGLTFTAIQDYINVKIVFDGTTADLWVNGVEVVSDTTYTAGSISDIRITTGPTGTSSLTGEGHYDNMVLMEGLTPNKPEAPVLNTIPSPDADGTYSVSWNVVSDATQYELYRSTTSISDIGLHYPLYNGTSNSFSEIDLPEGTYYYMVVATNSSGTSELSNEVQVTVSSQQYSNTIVFMQNFNEEIPANSEGDGVYRLPTGWDGIPPGTFPGGTYMYPLTSTAGGHAGPLGTVHLGIIDAQSGSFTETWRTFPTPVEVGIFEFTYYMYSGNVFRSNLILESTTGTDLLTITTAKTSAVSTAYTISLEGIDSGLTFTAIQDYINVKVMFDGTTADLWVNGVEVVSDATYTAGSISDIRITTGPTGTSSLLGEGHYDNMVLTEGLTPDKPEAPILNTIPSPDADGTYSVSWNYVSDATQYELYRSTTSISDIGLHYPLYSGTSNSFSEIDLPEGTYYYMVVATNSSGTSELSNEVQISIIYPNYLPEPPILNSVPSPDLDGTYSVSWNSVDQADTYQLYRESTSISDLSALTPIFNGPSTSISEIDLPEGTYYYVVVATNSSGTSELSNEVQVSVSSPQYSNTIMFMQNFNEEIPANNEGDGVYRLPTGWSGLPPGTFPGGTYTYPLTSTAGGHAGPLGTVHLGIIDSQSGSFTETWRTFPTPVEVGIFEFTYYMYSNGVFQSNLILESATGTDLLTITTVKSSTASTAYTISLEGIDSGLTFTAIQDYINVKVVFDGTTADLWVNGVEVVSDATYTAGSINDIRITTGPTGTSSLTGEGHYDNMVLTEGLTPNKPEAPVLNAIPSPDSDGSFTISWNFVSDADGYELYRSTTSISDIGLHYPLYSGTSNSFSEIDLPEGTYYYVVVATNSSGTYELSNEVQVSVIYPNYLPEPPILNSVPSPDSDGTYSVNWNSVDQVDTYQLYRESTSISDISALTPIYNGPSTSFSEIDLPEGIYYYVVVATNSSGTSELSNEVQVSVDYPIYLPEPPILNSVPSPDSDGTYSVSWNSVDQAETYQLYRASTPINDISALTPIYNGPSTSFSEIDLPEGTYYYVVVAINSAGTSELSNEVFVNIVHSNYPSDPPILNTIPSPDLDGNFTISWNFVEFTDTYQLYGANAPITDISSLTPIYSGASNFFSEIDLPAGTYYYVVVATNSSGTSELSNEIEVVVVINDASEFTIDGYSSAFILLSCLGGIGIIAVTHKRRK
jgi:hypothetical protein